MACGHVWETFRVPGRRSVAPSALRSPVFAGFSTCGWFLTWIPPQIQRVHPLSKFVLEENERRGLLQLGRRGCFSPALWVSFWMKNGGAHKSFLQSAILLLPLFGSLLLSKNPHVLFSSLCFILGSLVASRPPFQRPETSGEASTTLPQAVLIHYGLHS